ncbi:hypothetical protein HZB90_02695 [archaeon]|nr:hypothetical protein [archaeon]
MYEDMLSEFGLTKSEIAVYFALLDLGSSTTGPVIKKAGIASGKAYLVLDKIIQKGLVTYVIAAGRKYYQAKDPDRLLDYLKEKEKDIKEKEDKLKQILPTLKAKYEEQKYRPRAEVFEGNRGFVTFYEGVLKELKRGDTLYVMGVSRQANERFAGYLAELNLRRVSKGIRLKIIYHHDCRETGRQRAKLELTEVRYMPEELETPAWIDIYGDYVATINATGNPVVFLMRDKESAESYRKYFDMLWGISKK